jgi:predicted helicase
MKIAEYQSQIEKELARKNATEHTHRPALKTLIESLADGITATNEPKRVKCGAPDFVVARGEVPIGYVEAKDVGKSLDEAEASDQLKRYRESLSNLILTDYLEFRWYIRGELRLEARLAKANRQGKLKIEKEGVEEVRALLQEFLAADPPTVLNAKDLATRMASLARLIRNVICKALEDEDRKGELHQQMKSFQNSLVSTLTEDQFADMYAQTICYGLFAARYHAKGGERFTRQHAAYQLPKTNPFLRKMFSHIAGVDLDDRIAWAVDDLAELLHRADISAILEDFGKRTRREDPVVHFYETFLAVYDPKMREVRGVYYTPEPVVSYIVRSVDHILKTDFGLSDGLADAGKIEIPAPSGKGKIELHKVLILDPATGTGTFLHGVIDHIFESFKSNRGMWSGYVSQHLLPRLLGFELLMAPYAVAHLKLGLQLSELGYDFQADERLRVFLTNALEKAPQLKPDDTAFTHWLFEEAEGATKTKQESPVMVVLGNPPYSGHSANTGQWIADLLRGSDTITGRKTGNYFEVDGQPLGERNPKWLNDDYVKFIRFAQWRIEQTGYGILAFITNHGYLDNPTFRGMRQSLMQTFDDIYVLNLHGNSKKKEIAPDGSKDENVFDIQQGAAIGIFVKRRNIAASERSGLAKVHHAHLWGVREIYEENAHGEQALCGGKYHWLWQHDIGRTKWTKLKPQSPFYLFAPLDGSLRAEYERGWKLTAIIPVNGVGMTTARDHIVIDCDEQPLLERARLFRDSTDSDKELCQRLGIPLKKGWDVAKARQLLRRETDLKSLLEPVLYRPFDERLILYHDSLVWRTVKQVMRHMLAGRNLGLSTTRSVEIKRGWEHIFCTTKIIQHHTVSLKEVNYLFPLYRYPNGELPQTLFDYVDGRRPNLSTEFITDFAARVKLQFIADGRGDLKQTYGPEDVFAYLYAVFHSPTYRTRYAEFLKIDFPRLPLTSDVKLFRALCRLGAELVGLHLMEKHAKPITSYPQPGDNTVEQVRYDEQEQRAWINKEQYFEGVPPEVWEFHVGGYQVCQKWLKDRKGRQLTYDDLTHYQRVVSALAETMRLMNEIDETINAHGGWPIR